MRIRMLKAKCPGMEGLARAELKAIGDKLAVLGKGRACQYFISAIHGIVKKRMAKIFHVCPDLMGPAGLQPAFNKRGIVKAFKDFVMRNSLFGIFIVEKNLGY